MKRLLTFAIVGVLGYFGYQWYQQSKVAPSVYEVADSMIIRQAEGTVGNVLGAAKLKAGAVLGKATEFLNGVTDGQAEPVINKAVADLQGRLKEVPAEQYERVKYEFCKDVLPSTSPQGGSPSPISSNQEVQ